MEIQELIETLSLRFSGTRVIEQSSYKRAIIHAANDLISEFKQNVCIVNYTTEENKKVIQIPNIATIFSARFEGNAIPITRLSKLCEHDTKTKLIVLDTQSVRLEPFAVGELEIMGSFYVASDSEEIALSPFFTRAILQGATLELYIALDKPLEHIKNAKILYNDIKDELRSQINRAQEKQAILTKGIRI